MSANICVLAFSHVLHSSRIFSKEALSLVRSDYDVYIIARSEQLSYGEGEEQGVRFLTYPRRPGQLLYRLVSDPYYWMRMIWDAWKANADVYHCHEPQSLMVGIFVAKMKGVKVVYDCHEYQPEATAEHFGKYLYPAMKRILRAIERLVVRLVDGVVTVNEQLADRFRMDCAQVISLPNYPLKEMFSGEPQPPPELAEKLAGKKVLIYVGGISPSRGVTACLYTLKYLKAILPNIFMLFIGRINPDYHLTIERLLKDLQISNQVIFLGQVHPEGIFNYMGIADLGVFLVQPDNERYRWGEPIKFFEYSAAGLPVVMSDLPAKRRLIEDTGNGIVVDPENYFEVASKIVDLVQDPFRMDQMRQRGLHAFQTQYNWSAVESRLLGFYQSLISN